MKKISTALCFFLFVSSTVFGQCNLDFSLRNEFDNSRYNFQTRYDLCTTSSAKFIADDIPNATYQWYLNDKVIAGATQNSYVIKDSSGIYTVKAIIGNCSYSMGVTQ